MPTPALLTAPFLRRALCQINQPQHMIQIALHGGGKVPHIHRTHSRLQRRDTDGVLT